jgi:hypothetical protein
MAFLRLKGPQLLTLRNLLKPAFSKAKFEELLLQLDRSLDDFAGSNEPLPTAILNTLKHANAELWWRDLLREACNAVPDPQLLEFSKDVGFAPDVVAADPAGVAPLRGRQLELKIRDSGSTFEILTWRQRLADIEGRVCRVEFPPLQARGTGFLVAPDHSNNTGPGSSGAPCFSADLDLVGMHLGAKRRGLGFGVTMAAIVADLEQKGLAGALRTHFV